MEQEGISNIRSAGGSTKAGASPSVTIGWDSSPSESDVFGIGGLSIVPVPGPDIPQLFNVLPLVNDVQQSMNQVGQEQKTSTATAKSDLTIPDTAVAAVIQAGTDISRIRADGTSATSALGIILQKGDILYVRSRDFLEKVSYIRAGTVDAVLDIAYFKD